MKISYIRRAKIAGKVIAKLEKVTKSFGKKQALKGISFNVFADEIFGYIGPNGAGKTTTIRLLTGLLPPSEGKVTVFDKNPYISDALRSKIGVVMDAPGLWENLTVTQNMKYFSAFYNIKTEKEIQDCLNIVDLDMSKNLKVTHLIQRHETTISHSSCAGARPRFSNI